VFGNSKKQEIQQRFFSLERGRKTIFSVAPVNAYITSHPRVKK